MTQPDSRGDALQTLSEAQYRKSWKSAGPLEIRMVEQSGKCMHQLGECFRYEHPYSRPAGVCHALLHVLELYVWRATLGFASWEADDRRVFRIHCPSKKGTVWELRKLETDSSDAPRAAAKRPKRKRR